MEGWVERVGRGDRVERREVGKRGEETNGEGETIASEKGGRACERGDEGEEEEECLLDNDG